MAQVLSCETWVRLHEDTPGSVENYTGKRVPLTMRKGTLVTINDAVPFIRELATGESMSMPNYEHAYSFRCAMATQWRGYSEDVEGGVKLTSPIPHKILSTSPGGPVDESNFYHKGDVLFLLEDHEYIKDGPSGDKGWVRKNDAIIVTSKLVRSATVAGRVNLTGPKLPKDALYCFQIAFMDGSEGHVIWKSDHYFVHEDTLE